jgi:hypothetical protein
MKRSDCPDSWRRGEKKFRPFAKTIAEKAIRYSCLLVFFLYRTKRGGAEFAENEIERRNRTRNILRQKFSKDCTDEN